MGGLYKSMPRSLCHCIPPVAKEKLKDKPLKIQGDVISTAILSAGTTKASLCGCALQMFLSHTEPKELLQIEWMNRNLINEEHPEHIGGHCCL